MLLALYLISWLKFLSHRLQRVVVDGVTQGSELGSLLLGNKFIPFHLKFLKGLTRLKNLSILDQNVLVRFLILLSLPVRSIVPLFGPLQMIPISNSLIRIKEFVTNLTLNLQDWHSISFLCMPYKIFHNLLHSLHSELPNCSILGAS